MAKVWKTRVSSLSVANGQRRDRPTEMGAVEATGAPPPDKTHKGNLYLMCELSAPAETWDDASSEIVDLAIQTFYESPGSVTAGLRQAVRTVNRHLLDTNAASIPGQEIWAGLTCVALRDNDLFIAQGGPSLVYVLRDGELLAFPKPDSVPEGPSSSPPLGEEPQPNVELSHCAVDEGDTFLLVASHLPYLADAEQITAALGAGDPDAVLQQISKLVQQGDFSAVAVQLIEATQMGDEDVHALPPTKREPSEPARIVASTEETVAPAAQPAISTAEEERPEAETGEGFPRPQRTLAVARLIEALSLLAALGLRALAKLVGGGAAIVGGASRILGPLLEGIGRGIVAVFGFLGDRFLIIGRQMLPGAETPTRKAGQVQAKPKETRGEGLNVGFVLVGLLVPLLVIGLAAGYWYRQSQERQAQVNAALKRAQNALQSSSSMPKAEARTTLAKALDDVAQARQLDPKAAGTEDLEQKLTQALDRVNGVARLVSLTQLDSYTTPEGRSPHRLALSKDFLFVLDTGLDRVIRYRRSGASVERGEPVLQVGQSVDGQTVGELLDISWVQAGNGRTNAGLLVLTQDRHLFEITEEGVTRADKIVQTEGWKQPVRMDTFVGNLYVLDAGIPEILKYAPTPEGSYALPPESWFAEGQPRAQNPVDMAIDGNIYVLQADGKVMKFMAGEKQDFPMDGLDTPLGEPQGIYADPDGQYVYVGDPSNKRIVLFNKDGHFVRQLLTTAVENDPLSQLVALAVDESRNQIYLLDSRHLWGAGIPPLEP